MPRTTSKLSFVIFVAASLSLPTLGADGPAPVLQRPVVVSSESYSLSEYLLAVFRSSGVFGGIAIVNDRCENVQEQLPTFTGTVQAAIEMASHTSHQLHWFLDGEGLVVFNTPSAPSLLNTTVRQFRFSRKEALTKSSSDLFDTPETRDRVKALHLIEYQGELGFAQLQQPTTPQDVVVLANTTVLEALEKMANNHAVWLYKESTCEKGEKGVMSLNWPIR